MYVRSYNNLVLERLTADFFYPPILSFFTIIYYCCIFLSVFVIFMYFLLLIHVLLPCEWVWYIRHHLLLSLLLLSRDYIKHHLEM